MAIANDGLVVVGKWGFCGETPDLDKLLFGDSGFSIWQKLCEERDRNGDVFIAVPESLYQKWIKEIGR